MLRQRVLTALVLAPLMLACIFWLADPWFRLFAAAIVVLGAWEWANISGFEKQSSRIWVVLAAVIAMLAVHFVVPVDSAAWLWLTLLPLLWWVLAAVIVKRFPSGSQWLISRKLRVAAMVPVLGAFWMGLIWLKVQESAVLALTWLMLLVWGADIGAYFAGRAFGKRKLAPNVSPGKTWAGAYGGMATAVLVSVVLALLFLPAPSLLGWFFLTILSIAVIGVSILGDLFESLLKRHRGIKDSSQLLPGHGGVLDRIDSLCAATPMFTLFWLVLA